MKTLASLLAFFLISCKLFAQSPGGIVSPDLWLQGNLLADSSRLTYMNYNPATTLEKGEVNVSLTEDMEALQRVTVFTVYRDSITDKEKTIWEWKGEFGDLSLSSDHVSSKSKKVSVPVTKQHVSKGASETFVHCYSGAFIDCIIANSNHQPAINFGNISTTTKSGGSLKSVAELLVYKRLLDEKELAKVETYLALKYGVTLEEDYINAKGDKIWNWEKNKRYSFNISGIGRDDRSALYQKQSASSSSAEDLTIGISKIATSNLLNTGSLKDGTYLIWGDNGKEFTSSSAISGSDILFADKKWLLVTTSESTNPTTELKINTKTFLPENVSVKDLYLIIDRSASGFRRDSYERISPQSVSENGIATFENVIWDTDGSGKDNFTFAYKPAAIPETMTVSTDSLDNDRRYPQTGLRSYSVFPNPVTDGNYTVSIQFDKPTDFVVNLYDLTQHLIKSRKVTGQQFYQFTDQINGKPGTYFLQIVTGNEETYKVLILQ